MDLIKSYEFFKPEMMNGKMVHIIGCGSVGATVAENLCRFGIKDFVLYDFDVVEKHNIANQIFVNKHIGTLKTEALSEILTSINPDVNIRRVNVGWKGQPMAGYVFLAVDNIETRKAIVEKCKASTLVEAMFDVRTGLTDAQHYAANWRDSKSVKKLESSMDFTHEEAAESTVVSACGAELSVCPTIRVIVGYAVANFINFVKGEELKEIIIVDAFKFEVASI